MEEIEQSRSVSPGKTPDLNDPEKNIQLVDLVGNIQPIGTRLPSTIPSEDTRKTKPVSERLLGDKDSEGSKPPFNMESTTPSIADLSGSGAEYQVDETQSTRLRYQILTKNKGKTSSEVELEHHSPSKDKPKSSKAPDAESDSDSSSTDVLKKYDDKSPLTQKAPGEVSKEDLALKKKVLEASEAYTRNSSNLTELLSLIKTIDLPSLKTTLTDLYDISNKQDEKLTDSFKSSTNMTWNMGSRLSKLEHTHAALKTHISFIKQDTLEIKSMMVEMYNAFKVQ
nr:hypothetical protein [Tanacetum cinerariifolium]